jgi:hypothetical protein
MTLVGPTVADDAGWIFCFMVLSQVHTGMPRFARTSRRMDLQSASAVRA